MKENYPNLTTERLLQLAKLTPSPKKTMLVSSADSPFMLARYKTSSLDIYANASEKIQDRICELRLKLNTDNSLKVELLDEYARILDHVYFSLPSVLCPIIEHFLSLSIRESVNSRVHNTAHTTKAQLDAICKLYPDEEIDKAELHAKRELATKKAIATKTAKKALLASIEKA